MNSLIADDLDVDHINDYIEQGRAHPDYERIEKHLYKLRDAYPDIVFLYVYQIREDGCHVVFDLETEDLPADQPGEVVEFDESFRDYIPDLLAGREVKPVISRDTYGFLLTIYTPLYDSQGVCQCYAAVDYSMDLLIDKFKAGVAWCQSDLDLQPWQRVSAATGIATYEPGKDTCMEDVLKRADAAMYQDKVAMKAERRD